jgi:hypothetical protein
MGGQQTGGFDVVMEFSEKPLQDVLGVALDTNDFLCGLLGFLQIPCQGFAVSVSLDRPTNPALTPDQTNAVDIQISGGLLVLWRIRIIAGIDVDRSNPLLQSARLNLHDRLYHLSATVGGAPVNTDALASNLRDIVRAIALPVMLPVTAEPAPTIAPTRLDVQVIDAAAGANAFAVGLTFGGGTPGDLAGLTSSAIPAGGDVAVMVGFGYLMRLMEPALEAGLGLEPGDFVDGHLTRRVEIDPENDVYLAKLDFTLVDKAISVRSRVEKSGTCYTASADFGGDFTLDVTNSVLHVGADLSDPDFDIDVPWYCWLGAAVLGLLLGGLIGAVLLPVLLHLVTSTVEDVVNTVADTVVAAVNAATPDLSSVPAVGFDLPLENAFIDDVGIGCRFVVRDTAPVRCQGTVRLRPGQELDLDNGRVGPAGTDGADLRWVGVDNHAELDALCISRIADTPWVRFDEVPRYRLYGLDYGDRSIPVADLGLLKVIDLPFVPDIEMFIPTMAIYGVRTNERRLAMIQVTGIADDAVTLRYKTFGVADPTVRILGDFACPPRKVSAVDLDGKLDVESVSSRPPIRRNPDLAAKVAPLLTRGTARRRDKPRPLTEIARLQEMAALEGTLGGSAEVQLRSGDAQVSLSASELLAVADERVQPMSQAIARRFAVIAVARQRTAVFTAVADRISDVSSVTWWINGIVLDADQHAASIDGVGYEFSQGGRQLSLTTDSKAVYEFELRAAVENANADRFETSRCIQFDPVCRHQYPVTSHWKDFVGVVKGYPTTVLR